MIKGGIVRKFDRGEAWNDHLAMSGAMVDLILEWKVAGDAGFSAVFRTRFPRLRTQPNNTHASFEYCFKSADIPAVRIDGEPSHGTVDKIAISEVFAVSLRQAKCDEIREIFTSPAAPAVIEWRTFTNISEHSVTLEIPDFKSTKRTLYPMRTYCYPAGRIELEPHHSVSFTVLRTADAERLNPAMELSARIIDQPDLMLETPSRELNTMFRFALRRATESIFDTLNGPVHSPGGYNKYLAAIWANDEAEYANPLFAFTGSERANAAALNSYRWFMKYMNPEYRPLPSSIIAEGTDCWRGAGDRGDAAMIAHGAARYALAAGNRETADELLELVEWCLEYCRRQMTADGVIASDCDELELRFPAGDANLSTSCLYLDGLRRGADLRRALDKAPGDYPERADALADAIERHFQAEVEGFDTYAYYTGNTVLRSWICLPLCFGLNDRKKGTLDALFSTRLWRGDGLLTSADDETYWDRSTLYALRGVFACGEPDMALKHLRAYTRRRLLGDHVPYPVEANSEFSASQLSGEGALYCRIFIEGLFGITPTGLDSFTVRPQLPKKWKRAAMRNISAFSKQSPSDCTTGFINEMFGENFGIMDTFCKRSIRSLENYWDIELERVPDGIRVNIPGIYDQTLPEGVEHTVKF